MTNICPAEQKTLNHIEMRLAYRLFEWCEAARICEVNVRSRVQEKIHYLNVTLLCSPEQGRPTLENIVGICALPESVCCLLALTAHRCFN